MNKLLKIYILFFSFAFTISCNGQNCNEINTEFDSYQSALEIIKSSEFKISDKCDTSKSSWIYNAEYFSCDEENGFLLLTTKTKTYIHKNVPIKIWNEFKKAESFGSFYSGNIKNRYQLIL